MALAPDGASLTAGWQVMIERNRGLYGIWADFIERQGPAIAHTENYNRLSIIQPAAHPTHPWTGLILSTFSVGIWYNVINQFMIQRVLGAKNMYHARMGIVLAGYMKILMPAIVVVPGLILFAHPAASNLLEAPLEELRAGGADRGYVQLLHMLLPVGVRGLFLAALVGAIQSTINSVLNSTATVVTLDIYKRHLHKQASEKTLIRVGRGSTVIILALSILLAGWIKHTDRPLFVYIQELYAFFAPPFSAVFLLGILSRRINAQGAIAGIAFGFPFGLAMKVFFEWGAVPPWLLWAMPYAMQGILNWLICSIICLTVSLATAPPRPEQITDQLALNLRKLNIFDDLGTRWYNHVLLWWGIFAVGVLALVVVFSGLWW